MTWKAFPLPFLHRWSNNLEAARGGLAWLPSPRPSRSKAGLKANKSSSSSQWSVTANISQNQRHLSISRPSYNQTRSWLAVSPGPADSADCRAPGLGTRDICAVQQPVVTLAWAAGSATSLCTLLTTGHQSVEPQRRQVMDINSGDQWQHLQCWQNISETMSWLRNVSEGDSVKE